MNDRFKFRFWDSEHNCYADTDFIPEYVVSDGDIVDLGLEIINGAIPEQCTGLKDKNGKLIYEGDIVTDGCVKRTVMWDGWYWNAKAKANCPLDNITCSIVEIVGNIHEQAE